MPKTEADFPLTQAEVNVLSHFAVHTYHKQADTCFNMNAPLAGCIMAGAAAESILTIVTCLLYDDALKTGRAPTHKGRTKHLLDWKFSEFLRVAKAANWLPEELQLDERLAGRPVDKPVPTDSIREVRNLVHPARSLKDRTLKEYTVQELQILYATCHAAYDCLINKICERYPQFGYFKSPKE
jgi:hypothetical protein